MSGAAIPPRIIAITDRRQTGGVEGLLARCEVLIKLAVPAIMLREKDLDGKALFDAALRLVHLARGSATRIIINGRPDLALASRAHGVHFGAESAPLHSINNVSQPRFLLGKSHHPGTGEVPDFGAADYVLASPVFAPLSKSSSLAPLGFDGLRAFARDCPKPVIALGGITVSNARAVLDAGAYGVAGIGTFMNSDNDAELAELIRAISDRT